MFTFQVAWMVLAGELACFGKFQQKQFSNFGLNGERKKEELLFCITIEKETVNA